MRNTREVAVTDGAVTLTGHVPSYAENMAAVRAAERVYGVKAVANDLHIKVEVSGHIARLYGNVHSMHEATAGTAAATAAPGVAMVENHLVVTP